MNLFCVSACFCFLWLRAFWISSYQKSALTEFMTYYFVIRMREAYIEQECSVDQLFAFFRWIRQKLSQLIIRNSRFVEVDGVELLETRYIDGSQFTVCQQPLSPTQSIPHELHGALVIGRKVQLAFDSQNHVEVFFGPHEVAQVRRHYLSSRSKLGPARCLGPYEWLLTDYYAWLIRLVEIVLRYDEIRLM